MFRIPLLAAALALASPAFAQMSEDVHFQKGNFGAMVTGTIKGHDYFDHKLRAKGGQQMFAELRVAETNGNGTIYFNILPPGSDSAAIYIGSRDGNTALIDLPKDGVYTIRTYLMGNDRDSGKTVSYNLDLSIQ
ncbi:hypothetical protein [Meridianimarinicoccus sp. MJW13]|uniref:hypothetical protein n=1 Tax=Meridianimarinicoccus sp. MJW13 TaxID=2720031 RepID=UPI0018674D48|nr:hypothetical protein [Fluviibacterium sp. MJW13]